MPKDFRGRDIKVGDLVVYPGRHGSHLWMNEAEVVGVDKTTSAWSGEQAFSLRVRMRTNRWVVGSRVGKLSTIHKLSNVVVLEEK